MLSGEDDRLWNAIITNYFIQVGYLSFEIHVILDSAEMHHLANNCNMP